MKKTINILFDIPKKRMNNTHDYFEILELYIINLQKLKLNIKLNIWIIEPLKKLLNHKQQIRLIKLIKLIKNSKVKINFKKIRISKFEKSKIEDLSNFILFYYFLLKVKDKNIYSHIDLFFNRIPYDIPAQYFIWRNKRKIQKSKKFYRNISGFKIYLANVVHNRNINRKNTDKKIKLILNLKNLKFKINNLYSDIPKLLFTKFNHTKALYLKDKNPSKYNKEFYYHFDDNKIYKKVTYESS